MSLWEVEGGRRRKESGSEKRKRRNERVALIGRKARHML